MRDLLGHSTWSCARTEPGRLDTADPSLLAGLEWIQAAVPGTAAEALAGTGSPEVADHNFDAEDWWFRCRFPGEPGTWQLRLNGIATLADVWVNGTHVARTENMFVRSSVPLAQLDADNELVIRCEALTPALAARRPRPRWKTGQVEHQALRWFRTDLLGRIPGWARTPRTVGPWKSLEIIRADEEPLAAVLDAFVLSSCDGDGGRVDAALRFATLPAWAEDEAAELFCLGCETPFEVERHDDGVTLRASLPVTGFERWWPHTHGPQPLYDVALRIGPVDHPLGRVGFRTIEVDRADGGFTFVVNGVPIFVRGANWFPPDPVSFRSGAGEVRRRVGLVREANLNMLRIPGTTVYADRSVLEACDELGVLLWQDCMFAFMDYPDDEAFVAGVGTELRQAFADLSGHPCLAIVCGNQEVAEIAAMNGGSRTGYESELFDSFIPALTTQLLPGVEFVASNPTGGDPVYRPDTGVSQYFGIGGYLRPLNALRRDDVRFAAETLCYATPPEPDAVTRLGGANLAVHDPRWKVGVHHDPGRSWDMDDVRSFYVRDVFGVDPLWERYSDAERALDLGRATNAYLMQTVFTEWRCNERAGGGLVLGFNDVAPGAGWGLIDVSGHPKAPWFAMRRVSEPVCVLVMDEGLNGICAHVFNDTADAFTGELVVELFTNGESLRENAVHPVSIKSRDAVVVNLANLFDEFTDLNYAYRFGPPKYDVIAVTLKDESGAVRSDDVTMPLGQARAVEGDIGLSAVAICTGDAPQLHVTTRRFAQWVSVNAPGYRPSDSWFHLPPGSERIVTLLDGDPAGPPRGRVRALNSTMAAVIRPGES
jgi:beta-mannosidase